MKIPVCFGECWCSSYFYNLYSYPLEKSSTLFPLRPPFVLVFYPFVLLVVSKKTLVQKDKCVYDAISSLSVRFRPPNIHFRKRLIKSFRLIIVRESYSWYNIYITILDGGISHRRVEVRSV